MRRTLFELRHVVLNFRIFFASMNENRPKEERLERRLERRWERSHAGPDVADPIAQQE